MTSWKPHGFNKANDKIFKLEVKHNCFNYFFPQRTKLLYEKEDLAQSEHTDLGEKWNYVLPCVTKNILCYAMS